MKNLDQLYLVKININTSVFNKMDGKREMLIKNLT